MPFSLLFNRGNLWIKNEKMTDKPIYIIGPLRLQNRLMAFFLERETGVRCFENERFSHMTGIDDNRGSHPGLVLLDCLEKDLDGCLSMLGSDSERLLSQNLVALFNVGPEMADKESALGRGVRGFFYEQDPPERFPKGVRAILDGELWVSREIMARCIIENRDRDIVKKEDDAILTPREAEILIMVATGAKNEEIAERLFISPNTVKTHIYNIFKKINVPNRLQAALWAAKNL